MGGEGLCEFCIDVSVDRCIEYNSNHRNTFTRSILVILKFLI